MSNHYDEKEQYLPHPDSKKTIIDAINHFQGESPSLTGEWLVTHNGGSYMYNKIVPMSNYLICTIEEYNHQVVKLSHHGGSLKYWNYKSSQRELLTKENSDYSHYEKQPATVTITDLSPEDNARFNQEIKDGKWSPLATEDQASKNLLKAVLEVESMKEQLKFTVECKELIKVPAVDMLARIEFNCQDKGLMVMDFTFKFETETEYAGVDKYGFAVIVEKEEFIAWHAVDEPSELDIAKEKQIADVLNAVNHSEYLVSRESIRLIQEQGMLAEIILPLKK